MWEKMKKAKALALAGALLGSVLLSTEASAAAKVTTGTSCTTKMKNKTTKVTSKGSTETYKCTTNPTAKGTAAKKLVWVSTTCIDIDKIYKDTIIELNKFKADPSVSATAKESKTIEVDTYKTYVELSCAKGY
jgi:hypothetical protein